MLVVALAAVSALLATQRIDKTVTGAGTMFAQPPYVPQPERTAEWTGNPNFALTDDQVEKLAANTSIEVLPKFANGFDLSGQFADARRLVAAGVREGNPVKVFAYFSAAYWFGKNTTGWGPYAQTFSSDWLLTDRSGDRIPFYGQRVAKAPVGYLLDLRNPDLRAWAVETIVAWMKQAPFAGVTFDSATPIAATAPLRRGVGAGRAADYPSLLCGADSAACPVIDDWNAGLQDLIQRTTDALHGLHLQTIYNGIAPSVQRTQRNVALLQHADIAANEAFCYSVKRTSTGHELSPTSFTADAAIMRAAAAQNKGVLQITNYGDAAHRAVGDYCLAGFLMGWQPGHSWYVFHTGYADRLDGDYPEVPEQNLALGGPTDDYTAHGTVLSRTFDNGFVAVNTGNAIDSVRVPHDGTSFADGLPGHAFRAGSTATLPPHSALFVLDRSYLDG